jgi:hypothetical protein
MSRVNLFAETAKSLTLGRHILPNAGCHFTVERANFHTGNCPQALKLPLALRDVSWSAMDRHTVGGGP